MTYGVFGKGRKVLEQLANATVSRLASTRVDATMLASASSDYAVKVAASTSYRVVFTSAPCPSSLHMCGQCTNGTALLTCVNGVGEQLAISNCTSAGVTLPSSLRHLDKVGEASDGWVYSGKRIGVCCVDGEGVYNCECAVHAVGDACEMCVTGAYGDECAFCTTCSGRGECETGRQGRGCVCPAYGGEYCDEYAGYAEVQKIHHPGAAASDQLGASGMSMSADGLWLAVSAPNVEVDGVVQAGAVYVYSRSSVGESFAFHQSLIDENSMEGDKLGGGGAELSGNGRVLVVHTNAVSDGDGVGALLVYKRAPASSANFTFSSLLFAPPDAPEFDYFGKNSLAVSHNGRIIIAGARGRSNFTGAAFYFKDEAVVQTITANNASEGDRFSYWKGVALSSDGTVLACSVPFSDIAFPDGGAVAMFRKGGIGLFEQFETITLSYTGGAVGFGSPLTISADGKRVVARRSVSEEVGAVHMFEWDATNAVYTEVGNFSGNVSGAYGAVACDQYCDLVIVGNGWDSVQGNTTGAVEVYVRNAWQSTYYHAETIQSSQITQGALFGLGAFAVAREARVLAVGAPSDSTAANNAGGVVVFSPIDGSG
mmetsp:Transcript_39398/g.100985  ORF Transcript_39398/g.100985 Transcript_39398/m.100985 type:complete len:598 (-) Transcript_39398:169-1962(-)